jgi:hypothetical protein
MVLCLALWNKNQVFAAIVDKYSHPFLPPLFFSIKLTRPGFKTIRDLNYPEGQFLSITCFKWISQGFKDSDIYGIIADIKAENQISRKY